MEHTGSAAEIITKLTERITAEVSRYVFGQPDTARLLAGAFLIGGHVLIEGPPGIAKTLLARAFAGALGLKFKRVQFTPDLMPSDVTGVYVFDQKSCSFRFAAGPIFADIVLADEINRTPPKTQAALLEAMEERTVTIDGQRHFLGDMFFVVATQNPIEHEGTFPLPEAQLDRFLFKLTMGYPPLEAEEAMVRRLSGEPPVFQFEEEGSTLPGVQVVATQEELGLARRLLRQVILSPEMAGYVRRIVAETRSHAEVALGASPRAALNLALAAKLSAAQAGRDYTIPDDVKAVAVPVLSHRLIFHPDVFEEAQNGERVVKEVLARVPMPEGVAG